MKSHDMMQREIGSSGLRASAIGLGTWAIGGWMWGGTDEQQSIAAIQGSIDEGVSLIEWPDRLGSALPPERLELSLRHVDEGRRADLTGHGDWAARLEALQKELS